MKEFQDYKGIIFNSFNFWSIHSKSHSFPAMLELVQPKSSFYELTYSCQQSHETGTSYFYEFYELDLIGLSKNKREVKITGIIKLNIPKIDIVYKGDFISTCCWSSHKSEWLLNDIDIEWH